jgi:hypothetical protein
MTIRKFLTSVARVWGFDSNDTLVLSGTTLLDTSLDVSVSSVEARGGKGNPLLYTYFHTSSMKIQLTDVQFNLSMLGQTVGSSVVTGNNVWIEENVTVGVAGACTVTTATPLALPSTNVYGWATTTAGSERVTFTGSNFTVSGAAENDVICVRYFGLNSASRSINIPANILPNTLNLVLEADLNSGDQAGANKVGTLQILIPRAQLSGAFQLQLKSDGISNTPLSASALADEDLTNTACSQEPIFAKIVETLSSANWYDNLVGISVVGGNFGITTATSPKTLVVYGVKDNGDAPFIIPNSELSFTSGTVGTATAGLHTGVITKVANGTTLITVVVDDLTSVETQVTCTAS